jgi:hypothetical protein
MRGGMTRFWSGYLRQAGCERVRWQLVPWQPVRWAAGAARCRCARKSKSKSKSTQRAGAAMSARPGVAMRGCGLTRSCGHRARAGLPTSEGPVSDWQTATVVHGAGTEGEGAVERQRGAPASASVGAFALSHLLADARWITSW